MPKLISFEEEDNIYVIDVKQSIAQIPSERAKQPVVVSVIKSENKSFLIVSYKIKDTTEIKQWRTWLTPEDFTENYNYLIVHIDKEQKLCKVCGPVYSSLKSDAYVVAAANLPETMDRSVAESKFLSQERKKIVRYGSGENVIISFLEEDKCIHFQLTTSQAEEAKAALAFILHNNFCEYLPSEKWANLEEMQIPSLLSLCKTVVQRFWREVTISDEKITALPGDGFEDFKSKIELEKKLSPHLNFLKGWLGKHKEQKHFSNDVLIGTFELERKARASGAPDHIYQKEIDFQLPNITVFDFDHTLNKIRIVTKYKILGESARLVRFKISSCLGELNILKNLILCCYVSAHLENQLTAIVSLSKESTAQHKEINIFLSAMEQLRLKNFFKEPFLEEISKLTKENAYINIYNIGSRDDAILWIGESIFYHASFANIIKFIKSKELLVEKSLKFLTPKQTVEIIEESSQQQDTSYLKL